MDELWSAVLDEIRNQLALYHQEAQLADVKAAESWELVEPEAVTRKDDNLRADLLWREQQWYNAFLVLFWERASSTSSSQDDLVFFVCKTFQEGGKDPLLVCRKGKTLPREYSPLGQLHDCIAWKDTVLLNLVLQSAFRLTTIISRREDLERASLETSEKKGAVLSSVDVFASPSRLEFDTKKKDHRPERMSFAYPDICFSIDEAHSGFSDMILDNAELCLHVQLTAIDSLAFNKHSRKPASHKGNFEEPVVLLSGFVSFQQIAEALHRHKSIFQPKNRSLVINMRGPDDKGAALTTAKWQQPKKSRQVLPLQESGQINSGHLLNNFRTFARKLVPGWQDRACICCSMLEVNMPVDELARMILGARA